MSDHHTCAVCAEPIVGRRCDAVYCSTRCRLLARDRRKRVKRRALIAAGRAALAASAN